MKMDLDLDPRQLETAEAATDRTDERLRQILTAAGYNGALRPSGTTPTLNQAPDNMDVHTADILHHQACRWLEYIEECRAPLQAEIVLLKNAAGELRDLAKLKHGKTVDKWTEPVLTEVHDLERRLAEQEAFLLLLNGRYDSLQKVRVAASRTISRHKQ